MGDVSDHAEQIPTTPTPQAVAGGGSSVDQRPVAPASARQGAVQDEPVQDDSGQDDSGQGEPVQDESGHVSGSRFPSTGDARVDQALAHLPDPREHDRDRGAGTDDRADEVDAPEGNPDAADGDEVAADGLDLPDPALLDSHVADVTSVHRQLQQRLSDLSS